MEELLLRYIKGIARSEERREVIAWIEMDTQNRTKYETLMTVYMMSVWNDPQGSSRSMTEE
jgi:hypothetical protein